MKQPNLFTQYNALLGNELFNENDVEHSLEMLDNFSKVTYKKVYVVDFSKEEIVYVSDNFSRLCGVTPEYVKSLGMEFYRQFLSEEDFSMMKGLISHSCRFMNALPESEKKLYSVFCDFYIRRGRNKRLVTHQATPLTMRNGQPCLVLCVVALSANKSSGHLVVKKEGIPCVFHIWDEVVYRWKTIKFDMLTDFERDVILLSAQGMDMKYMSLKLCKSLDAVKSCKRRLFEKMCVDNIVQAVQFAQNYGLI